LSVKKNFRRLARSKKKIRPIGRFIPKTFSSKIPSLQQKKKKTSQRPRYFERDVRTNPKFDSATHARVSELQIENE
jgi:hypothetical protein